MSEKGKIILEGKLFVIEESDDEGYHFTAEIGGISIINWLEMNNDYNVKITLENLNE